MNVEESIRIGSVSVNIGGDIIQISKFSIDTGQTSIHDGTVYLGKLVTIQCTVFILTTIEVFFKMTDHV